MCGTVITFMAQSMSDLSAAQGRIVDAGSFCLAAKMERKERKTLFYPSSE